jgi:hypothetical protein
VVGDFILIRAAMNTVHAHQAHGMAVLAYAAAALISLALWAWVLRRKPPAKPAARPYVPYGGPR